MEYHYSCQVSCFHKTNCLVVNSPQKNENCMHILDINTPEAILQLFSTSYFYAANDMGIKRPSFTSH